MINTEKLEKILKKKKDKIPALLEVLRLTGKLCIIDDVVLDNAVNTALSKVENLLSLQSQSKKTTGQILTDGDYKSVGIYESHIKKLRRKSKESPKLNRLMRLMPKLYKIKEERNLNYAELQQYVQQKYSINMSRTYFIKIFKKINF
jgi:spore coat polysaccharide biosynthesis protein SpsF (cytidylyltransferase family)